MNMLFCNNLKIARKSKGLSQSEVAKSLHIERYCYANWEQGRAEPSVTDIQKLCVILEVSANELLGIEDGLQIRIADINHNH